MKSCKIQIFVILVTLAMIPLSVFGQLELRSEAMIEDIDYLAGRLEVMHPNIYANVTEEAFKGAVNDLKSRASTLTDIEFVFGIHEIVAMIQDSHTSVIPWKVGNSPLTDNTHVYPVTYYKFSDGIFVIAADKNNTEIVGKKVILLNDVPAEYALKQAGRFVGADNAQSRLTGAMIYMSAAECLEYCGILDQGEQLTLTLGNENGSEFEYTIDPIPLPEALGKIYFPGQETKGKVLQNRNAKEPLPLYLSKPGNSYWFKYLPESKTMYVCLLAMQQKDKESFADFYARMFKTFDKKKAEVLILDVRNNSGGNHYEQPLLKGVIARPDLDQTGKLFIIMGRETASASQHFVNQFESYTNVIKVGENTSAKPNFYGAQRFFDLPNSHLPIRTSIAYHQDVSDWDNANTSHVDFYRPLSSSDFANNQDPALDLILRFDEVKHLPELSVKKLAKAYKKDGVDGIKKAFVELKTQYADSGLNCSPVAYNFGNWLSGNSKKEEDVTEYLEYATQQYPDRSELWFWLALNYKNTGQMEKAKTCLHDALENHSGDVLCQRMLALINFEEEFESGKIH